MTTRYFTRIIRHKKIRPVGRIFYAYNYSMPVTV